MDAFLALIWRWRWRSLDKCAAAAAAAAAVAAAAAWLVMNMSNGRTSDIAATTTVVAFAKVYKLLMAKIAKRRDLPAADVGNTSVKRRSRGMWSKVDETRRYISTCTGKSLPQNIYRVGQKILHHHIRRLISSAYIFKTSEPNFYDFGALWRSFILSKSVDSIFI